MNERRKITIGKLTIIISSITSILIVLVIIIALYKEAITIAEAMKQNHRHPIGNRTF